MTGNASGYRRSVKPAPQERDMPIDVGYVVGSTSRQSINRKMLDGMIALERERDTGDELGVSAIR